MRRSPIAGAVMAGALIAGLAGCRGDAPAEQAPAPAEARPAAAEAQPAPAETPAPETPEAQLRARIIGDWRLDLDSLDADPQFAKLPPQQRMQALAMARQMMADVSFSFAEDGKVRLGFAGTGRTGTYTVDRVEGNALHVTTRTGSGEDETVEQVVLRVEGDAIVVSEGADGRTFRLLRGAPKIPSSQPAGTADPDGRPAQLDVLPPGHPPATGPARPRDLPGSQPTRAPGTQPAAPH